MTSSGGWPSFFAESLEGRHGLRVDIRPVVASSMTNGKSWRLGAFLYISGAILGNLGARGCVLLPMRAGCIRWGPTWKRGMMQFPAGRPASRTEVVRPGQFRAPGADERKPS